MKLGLLVGIAGVFASIAVTGPSPAEFIQLTPEQMDELSTYMNSPEYYQDQAPFALMECGILASYSDKTVISDRASKMVMAGVAMANAEREKFLQSEAAREPGPDSPLREFYDSWSDDFNAGVMFARAQDRIREEVESGGGATFATNEFNDRNCMYLPLENKPG